MLAVVAGILCCIAIAVSTPTAAATPGLPSLRLTALDGSPVDPFALPSTARAVAFVFLSVDCPVSARYAPELRRLHERHAGQGVAFTYVYPNPADSPESILAHVRDYGISGPALRDPAHALVRLAGVTVTPEAAVFERGARLVYRGRIDDRYAALGLSRPEPVERDLDQALLSVLAGRPPRAPRGPAVGCFIADFLP